MLVQFEHIKCKISNIGQFVSFMNFLSVKGQLLTPVLLVITWEVLQYIMIPLNMSLNKAFENIAFLVSVPKP